MPGCSARIWCAARRPSSVCVGGIRTSTTATSGLCAPTLRSRSSASPAWPATSKPDSSSRRARPSRSSTESSATTTFSGCVGGRSYGNLRSESSARPGWRVERQRPVQRGDPVGEPAQAEPRPGSAPPTPSSRTSTIAWPLCARDGDRGLRWRPRTWRRWSAPRRPRSRRRPRPARAAARPATSTSSTGIGERPASASSGAPAGRGRTARPGGCRAPARAAPRARSVQLLLGAGHQSLGACRGPCAIWFCAIRSVSDERDEPLLGAVVQVALQPPALGSAGLDDPRARGAQLLDARAQLGLQALVLRSPGRRRRRRSARSSGSSHSARSCTIAPTRWPSSSTGVHARAGSSSAGSSTGWPSRVTQRPLGRASRRRCSERSPSASASRLAQAAGAGRRAEAHEQLGDRAGARDARAQQAEQERERDRRRRRPAPTQPRTSGPRPWPPIASGAERAGEQHHQHDARPQQRRQRAPLRRRGGAPARGRGSRPRAPARAPRRP